MNACREGSAYKNSFAGSSANNNSVTETSASTSSFKTSKRKRYIPVPCNKSKMEHGNINEFVDRKETCSSRTSQRCRCDFVPNSLDVHNIKPESAFGYAQTHRGGYLSSVVPSNAADDCQPIDLSISKKNQNGTKTSNADIMQEMIPVSMMSLDPVQMQQYVDYMTKRHHQSQGIVHSAAAHALHFQCMLHQSMLSMMKMNNGVMAIPTSPGSDVILMPASTNGRYNKRDRISAVSKVDDKPPQEFLKVNNEQIQNNAPDDDTVAVVDCANKNDGHVSAAEGDKLSSKQGKKVPKSRTKRSCISKLDGIPLNDGKSNVRDHVVINNLKNLFPVNTNGTVTLDDRKYFKFFVRNNDQIQTIVNSLVEFGILERSAESDTENVNNMKHICRACNNVFFHAEHLIKHIKKHHILKKYACEECYRSFHDAGNYRQHKRVHDELDIPYECPYCHDFFRHKATLTVHVRTHTGEKPFNCQVCGAQFKISSGLQTHMRKHTGETPYACKLCSHRFKCQSNLKQHMFQHTQARPFSCEVCGKSYSRKSIRDKHMATHSNNGNSSKHVDEKDQPMH